MLENIQEKFDEDGKINDERSIKYFDKVVDNYIEWAKKVRL